ncbi:P-loop containing nucleoside triphosphate hydrolase protein [Mycena albidolilacea]|uniref:P-loop containing nucleoside triphosphate hydrolase protein n=1 Tax=Mycena albidolilacea TaxID=1033008 RepID=A0AAD7F437_9AGAR|nr:P-loop containing nucleoside triphosphate hydrolase protein [Mycena albidolilacea]
MSQDTVPQEDEVTVAVMGPTGSGKTSFINIVSGSNLRVGKSLQSCTSTVQVAPPFQLGDRWVTLIDTPGFDDTTRSDTEILTQIAAFLAAAYESGKKLAGVVYMHRISDVRMGGISTRNFKMFRQLCGESTLRNVVIVTNMWGEVLHEVGEAREAELAGDGRFFKAVLDKGARMLRHYNNAASATAILHYLIGNQPRALRIQRELVDQGKDILQTAAGGELNRELNAQIERHRQEMVKLQHDLQEAIREKDEETKKELEIETGKLQAEMIRVQNDSRKLASEYTQQRVELEKRMTQVAEAAKKEAEIAEENHRRQIEELLEAFQQTSSSAESEREKIRRQLTELQQQYEEVQSRRKGGRGILGNLAWILDAILNF